MSRANPQMNENAEELLEHLQVLFQERPDYGRTTESISRNLGWSYSKTRATILWCRNNMADSHYLVHSFKKGRNWYYKIPTLEEAIRYEEVRGRDVATRAAHTLFLVRKRAARFGVSRETSKRTKAYVEMLHWLREAGVEDAEALLEQALRPLDQVAA